MITCLPTEISSSQVARRLAALKRAVTDEEITRSNDALRAMGPLLPTPWGGLLVTRYEDCAQVLRDRSWRALSPEWLTRHRPGWQRNAVLDVHFHTVFQADPPEHTRQRALLGNPFPARGSGSLSGIVTPIVERALDDLEAALARDGQADFAALVGDTVPAAVMCAILGLPPGDTALVNRLGQALFAAVELAPTASLLRAANQAAVDLTAYLEEVFRHRAELPPTALIARQLQDNGASRRETVHLTGTLFGAGTSTTQATLSSAAYLLYRHPDQAAWLRAHPVGVGNAVEEVLRLRPPAAVVRRVAAGPTRLAGRLVEHDQPVHALIGGAHRDPAVFGDPDRFDVRRVPGVRSLAFGVGIHYCLGAQLARVIALHTLTALLDRFPRLRVVDRPAGSGLLALPRITRLTVAPA